MDDIEFEKYLSLLYVKDYEIKLLLRAVLNREKSVEDYDKAVAEYVQLREMFYKGCNEEMGAMNNYDVEKITQCLQKKLLKLLWASLLMLLLVLLRDIVFL